MARLLLLHLLLPWLLLAAGCDSPSESASPGPGPVDEPDGGQPDGGGEPDGGDPPDGGGEPEPEPEPEPDAIPVPEVTGDWTLVFTPTDIGIYVNDHTFFGDINGFRLVGITGTSGNPHHEKSFVQAAAPALLGPWTEDAEPALATADPGAEEAVLWAPHVWLRDDSPDWQMVYYGGSLRVFLASSSDGRRWTRHGRLLEAGRDPMVYRDVDGRYLLYATETRPWDDENWPVIAVYESHDGARFEPLGEALVGPEPRSEHGLWLESPFVYRYEGRPYLFVTSVSTGGADYFRTLVFVSDDPTRYEYPPLTELTSHAAEVVEADGRLWLSSCGWPKYVGEELGVKVAPLDFVQP